MLVDITDKIKCPYCNNEFNLDELSKEDDIAYYLMRDCFTYDTKCPKCGEKFDVSCSTIHDYSTSKTKERKR